MSTICKRITQSFSQHEFSNLDYKVLEKDQIDDTFASCDITLDDAVGYEIWYTDFDGCRVTLKYVATDDTVLVSCSFGGFSFKFDADTIDNDIKGIIDLDRPYHRPSKLPFTCGA